MENYCPPAGWTIAAQKKGGTQVRWSVSPIEATAPGRFALAAFPSTDQRVDGGCRVRRRRPPRSMSIELQDSWSSFQARRRQAPGRRHRRRGVETVFQSGADRRGAGSCADHRSREADAPCRGQTASLSTLGHGGRAAGQGRRDGPERPTPSEGHQADAGYATTVMGLGLSLPGLLWPSAMAGSKGPLPSPARLAPRMPEGGT